MRAKSRKKHRPLCRLELEFCSRCSTAILAVARHGRPLGKLGAVSRVEPDARATGYQGRGPWLVRPALRNAARRKARAVIVYPTQGQHGAPRRLEPPTGLIALRALASGPTPTDGLRPTGGAQAAVPLRFSDKRPSGSPQESKLQAQGEQNVPRPTLRAEDPTKSRRSIIDVDVRVAAPGAV